MVAQDAIRGLNPDEGVADDTSDPRIHDADRPANTALTNETHEPNAARRKLTEKPSTSQRMSPTTAP